MWLQREVNSTFYVNLDSRSPNLPPPTTTTTSTKMDAEVRTLKQELARTQDALRAATMRCRDLVRELDNRTADHESERALRDQQLSKILRALLVLEARLKQEQKSIRQLLCEKDQVIRNQQLEIAKLRRYTKNYIKCNRESRFGKSEESGNNSSSESNSNRFQIQMDGREQDGRENSALSKDIQDLKCEIITKLTPADPSPSSSPLPLPLLDSADYRIKKTHSFAGSDISKTSLTSSENTDVSIITTTTEGSPSLLSTEGFCEGESTDVSPSSTLNKSISRCTPTIMTDSENEITMILNDSQDEGTNEALENKQFRTKAVLRRLKKNSSSIEIPIITRSDSNDDGMDCNFASDDDDDVDNDGDDDRRKDAAEPVFKSSSIERFSTSPQDTDVSNVDKSKDFSSSNNNNNNNNGSSNNNVNNNDSNSSNNTVNNNNNDISKRIEIDEQITDDTSGNWYSDPDEDRTNDDTLSHDTYHPNSNHNSVLECVNQILLRDIEEEESVLSITRRYKHRGKVVRFQAKLSDIESVGSEVERRNSEEIHKELSNANLNVIPCNNFETTSSEDEFGMRIVQSPTINSSESHFQSGSFDEENADKSKAIPIVIIEPREEEIEEARNPIFASMALAQKKMPLVSPPLKLERIEEKTCLQMSAKGLTIAKNLDYEDIESLPGSNVVAPCKTPPALPPKPQFKNNTLILKKIPSPSFLIVESRKKQQQLLEDNTVERGKRFLSLISSPSRTSDAQKSLNFDEPAKSDGNGEEVNFWRNKFNDVRSAFQRQSDRTTDSPYEECRNSSPKVTNMIRHFEEFKIGDPEHRKEQRCDRPKESRYSAPDLDQEFDMRQNFEEFNLDECDLSGDPDRPEGDGSERLGILPLISYNENSISLKDGDVDSPSTLDYGYDHFLEATGLSNKSILTPSRLLSNHKGMLKPKDIKYKSRVRATAILEKHGISATGVINKARVKRWTGPFV